MLTDRQRALLLSYAEEEVEIDGTVNGVTTTTAGKAGATVIGRTPHYTAIYVTHHKEKLSEVH